MSQENVETFEHSWRVGPGAVDSGGVERGESLTCLSSIPM